MPANCLIEYTYLEGFLTPVILRIERFRQGFGRCVLERMMIKSIKGRTRKGYETMGIYVNPGNRAFREAINSQIYIDKSELISYTNRVLSTNQKNLCVSRPRRFGKSMAADMLVAYYSKGCDSSKLFSGKKIEDDDSFGLHLNQHNVIRLDIQQFLFQESHLPCR